VLAAVDASAVIEAANGRPAARTGRYAAPVDSAGTSRGAGTATGDARRDVQP
jgi:hypothetical protein